MTKRNATETIGLTFTLTGGAGKEYGKVVHYDRAPESHMVCKENTSDDIDRAIDALLAAL